MADVKIEVQMNGPYRVYGPIDLVDQDGNAFAIRPGQRVALCRCGQSNNKPFCDTSHRTKVLFDAPTRAT